MNSRPLRTTIFGALLGIPLGYVASYFAQAGLFRLGRSLVEYLLNIHDILLCSGDFASDGDWNSICVTAWLGVLLGPILCGVIAFSIGRKVAKQQDA